MLIAKKDPPRQSRAFYNPITSSQRQKRRSVYGRNCLNRLRPDKKGKSAGCKVEQMLVEPDRGTVNESLECGSFGGF